MIIWHFECVWRGGWTKRGVYSSQSTSLHLKSRSVEWKHSTPDTTASANVFKSDRNTQRKAALRNGPVIYRNPFSEAPISVVRWQLWGQLMVSFYSNHNCESRLQWLLHLLKHVKKRLLAKPHQSDEVPTFSCWEKVGRVDWTGKTGLHSFRSHRAHFLKSSTSLVITIVL